MPESTRTRAAPTAQTTAAQTKPTRIHFGLLKATSTPARAVYTGARLLRPPLIAVSFCSRLRRSFLLTPPALPRGSGDGPELGEVVASDGSSGFQGDRFAGFGRTSTTSRNRYISPTGGGCRPSLARIFGGETRSVSRRRLAHYIGIIERLDVTVANAPAEIVRRRPRSHSTRAVVSAAATPHRPNHSAPPPAGSTSTSSASVSHPVDDPVALPQPLDFNDAIQHARAAAHACLVEPTGPQPPVAAESQELATVAATCEVPHTTG